MDTDMSGSRIVLAVAASVLFAFAAIACSNEVDGLLDEAKRAERAGDFGGALVLVDRAIAIEAEKGNAHRRRGELLRKLGRREDALLAYDAAIAAANPSRSAHLKAIELCIELGRIEEAEQRFAVASQVLTDADDQTKLTRIELELKQGAPGAVGVPGPAGD